MPKNKTTVARSGGKKGNFADSRNRLLSLFADPDGRGERSWRQTFGQEREIIEPNRGKPFIAREVRRLSSDSK